MNQIEAVTTWIDAAQQKPSVRNVANYAAFVFSECSEMLNTLGFYEDADNLENLSMQIRVGIFDTRVGNVDRAQLLDDAFDTAWTSLGLMHMLADAQGAFAEGAASNHSKFENGVCELDSTGKVVKGPSYFKPDLAKFLRGA